MTSSHPKDGFKINSIDPPVAHKFFDLNEPELTRQEMKTILECSPAGIGIVKNRVLVWTNDIFYTMLGYEPDSLKGKNTRIFYADEKEYERVGRDLYANLDKYGNGLVETRLVRKNGTLFDCRIRASKLIRKDSSQGTIVLITDISELKMLQLFADDL